MRLPQVQRELLGQRTRAAHLQGMPVASKGRTGGHDALQRGGTRRVPLPHEAAGLGTAGKICQEVQGQGVGKIRAGDAGHETGRFCAGRGR
ncbi:MULTISPECIES: hypothetical protein [Bacteroides]|uniref:hypothetical protein n=1 Tax=Bacteroides TaxID=816 RepID=UPI0001A260C7|nr:MULTISPECIES: hypothetical protein [Bacteroides]UVQ39406.1 hypothetical protein NXU82_10070 [Bacteroides ovatus]